MPLETASFISQLVPTNPVHTDGLNASDSHARLIKTVLQTQFPNFGTLALTATPTALNTAGTAFATAGVLAVANNGTIAGGELKLSPVTNAGGTAVSGAVLIANTGTSGAPGSVAVVINDGTNANPLTAMTLTRAGALAATTSLNAPSVQKSGNELLPVGSIILWWGVVTSIPAGWALCNGATVNGNVTPDLRNAFVVGAGSTYAPFQTGGAASASGSTDSQGSHSHTGLTGASGAVTPTASMDSQGAHTHSGATQAHALGLPEIPAHDHGLSATDVLAYLGSGGNSNIVGGTQVMGINALMQGGGQGHTHGIASDGAHTHNVTVSPILDHTHPISADGAHTHSVTVATLPPFMALCYIMKVT